MTVKVDRRAYYVERRQEVRAEALTKVAARWSKPVGTCFDCGSTAELTFDHWNGYAPDSVRVGHGDQRAREAIAHPERFHIVCWPCHTRRTIRQIARRKDGLRVDAKTGSEVRIALSPRFQGWKMWRLTQSGMNTEAKAIQERDQLDAYNADLPEGKKLTMDEFKLQQRRYWRNVYRMLQGKDAVWPYSKKEYYEWEAEAARIEQDEPWRAHVEEDEDEEEGR